MIDLILIGEDNTIDEVSGNNKFDKAKVKVKITKSKSKNLVKSFLAQSELFAESFE